MALVLGTREEFLRFVPHSPPTHSKTLFGIIRLPTRHSTTCDQLVAYVL